MIVTFLLTTLTLVHTHNTEDSNQHYNARWLHAVLLTHTHKKNKNLILIYRNALCGPC